MRIINDGLIREVFIDLDAGVRLEVSVKRDVVSSRYDRLPPFISSREQHEQAPTVAHTHSVGTVYGVGV